MADEPAKVTALFGDWKPSAGTTDVIVQHAKAALSRVEERKMTAFAAVAIDEGGQAHMFFSHDPCRDTALIGGLTLLTNILCQQSPHEEVTPKGPSNDEPKSG